MAQIITLPSAPATGLTQLGQMLFGASADYANQKRQTDREAELRQQQLADVGSSREFATSIEDKRRQQQLADEATRRANQLTDVNTGAVRQALAALVHENLLDPKYLGMPDNNPEKVQAVAAAYAEAQRIGLTKEYADMLDTPDISAKPDENGNYPTLLTTADVHDKAKVDAARQKLGSMRAAQAKRTLDLQQNAQDTADSLQSEYDKISAQATKLENELATPPESMVMQPSGAPVRARAKEIARQNSGGKEPLEKDVVAQIPTAVQQLKEEAYMEAVSRQKQAAEQVKLLHDRATGIGSRLNVLAQKGIYPAGSLNDPMADTAPAPQKTPVDPAAADAARKAAMQSIIDEVKKRTGGGTSVLTPPPAAPPPVTAPLSTPPAASKPLYSDYPASVAAQAADTVKAQKEGSDYWASVGKTVGGLLTPPPPFAQEIGYLQTQLAAMPDKSSPQAAQYQNRLIQLQALAKQAQNQAAQPALQDVTGSPTAAAAVPPALSNVNGSTPFAALNRPTPWWQTNQPQPAMGF